ncbi:hypothetical protein BJ165DRAFT_703082 [Panaeolus papilionaceus]|nr:hypothetical protein BJ165DRAFT_703082 [Panaeolus papilionaceus]
MDAEGLTKGPWTTSKNSPTRHIKCSIAIISSNSSPTMEFVNGRFTIEFAYKKGIKGSSGTDTKEMTEIQDRAVAGLSLYCQATPAFAVREKTAREGLGMAYTSQTRQRVRVGRLAGAFKVETAKGDAGSGARFNCRVVALGCSIPCSILTSAVFSSTKTSHDLDSELYSHICFPMLSYPYMQSCLDWPSVPGGTNSM